MTESILITIKQMLGIIIGDFAFDQEILVNINSAFMKLNQLGVGPSDVFSIEDESKKWEDFITDVEKFSAIKSFIYLTVKLAFDPPGTSFHLESIVNQIREIEFRLTVQTYVPPVV
jgi:hypothetical protein